jgi:histone H3/H4
MERLPFTTVKKIAREYLCAKDESCKMSGQAASLLNVAAVSFIHFLTSTSLDYLNLKTRNTITTQEILDSVKAMGFHEFVDVGERVLEGLITYFYNFIF